MITFRPDTGGFYAFLADPGKTRILFWMKMLDQKPRGE